jgi:hypothetical protein
MRINFKSIANLAQKALANKDQKNSTDNYLIAEKIKEKLNLPGFEQGGAVKKPGLYANIHAKRKRIAAGSGEKMRKVGAPGAPTAKAFKQSALTAKKPKKRS